MSQHLQRGILLFQQSRYQLAEPELRLALADDVQNATAHAFLALCLAALERRDEAENEAKQAIGIEPDEAFHHFALGTVLLDRHRFKESRNAVAEAVRLDPSEARYFGLLAAVELNLESAKAALAAADQGLALDPDDAHCINMRAMALAKLGRLGEAGMSVESALRQDPDDATTHANMGWTLLQTGDHKKAMQHFREALRLDPNDEFAKYGIIEAMKSRNFIYRWLLKYFFWMSRFSQQAQWAILLGLFFGQRYARSLAVEHPAWEPFINPLLVAYFIFALLTWLGDPLMNLLLLIDRFGRWTLSADQKRGAATVGLLLLSAVGCYVGYLTSSFYLLEETAIRLAITALPASRIFQCEMTWPRLLLAGIVVGLVILALTPASIEFAFERSWLEKEVALKLLRTSSTWFINLAIGSQFAAIYLTTVRPRR